MSEITVACCQFAPTVGDPDASAERARRAIASAAGGGAQVIVLPELANSGYVFASEEEVRAAAVAADGAVLGAWAQAAGEQAVVSAGFCELGPDGTIYNSAALFDRTGVLAVYRKLHLWDREKRWFTPGAEPAPVVETRHGRIGLAICYDIEFPELTRGLALGGAELIALGANWPYGEPPTGERPVIHSLAAITAYLNGVFMAVSDRCGTERGSEFEGGSVIAGPEGGLLAGPIVGRDAGTITAACELSEARDKQTSPHNDAFADRRPEAYAPALLGH